MGQQLTATLTQENGNTTTAITTAEWVTATINLTAATRIAIRAQWVYMDNFTATSTNMGDVTSLTILSVSAPEGVNNGIYYIDAKPDGTFNVKYNGLLKNTGNVDLKAGQTDNYTLQVIRRDNSSLASPAYPIPIDLAVGESAEVSLQVTMPASARSNNGWAYYDVQENASGNTKEGYWTCVNLYQPVFVFQTADYTINNPNSASSLSAPIAFGMIQEETSQTFMIWNTGNAPLQVTSISVPDGFYVSSYGPLTVEPLEKKFITVTLPISTPGIYSGNIQVDYVGSNGNNVTYTLPVSGTVCDKSKELYTFDNGQGEAQFPPESVHPDGIYISSTTENEITNFFLLSSKPVKFILPLVNAVQGEQFVFDAWMPSYYQNAQASVYISEDRQHWTLLKTVGYSDLSTRPNAFSVTFDETGSRYLAFELTQVAIDNIYGFTLAPAPAHDWYLVGTDLPEEAIQNQPCTAAVSIKNISSSITEPAGSYTATLYLDGEAVATANTPTLVANNLTNAYNSNGHNDNTANPVVFNFNFRPHNVGTFPAYAEFRTGNYTLVTDEFDITIEEEQVQYETGTTVNGHTTNAPVDLKYPNSQTVALYTSQMLNLKDGDKISSITYRAYNNDSINVATTLLSAWYEWTDDASLSKPASTSLDTSGMTPIMLSQSRAWEFTGKNDESTTDYIVFQFSTPLVYRAGKNLRIVMLSIDPDAPADPLNVPADWKSPNTSWPSFERTATTGGVWCYRAYSSIDPTFTYESSNRECDFYPSDLPAIHIGLDVTPTFFTGTVRSGQQFVSNATLTLCNEELDVQYTGLTDSNGQFSIPVIQDKLTYNVTITAEGYNTLNAPVNQFADNVYTLVPQGQATDINETVANQQTSDIYYDLQGRRLNKAQLPKGIYIVNGKKVIK